jgi:hypothetical protein
MPLRACLGNGGIKWMEEDWKGFWEILTYNGNSSTQYPLFLFIPLVPKQALRRNDFYLKGHAINGMKQSMEG